MRCGVRAISRALLAWAIVFAAGAGLGAQSLDRPGTGFTATVASVDSFALVLRSDSGKLVTFPIEDRFKVPAGLVPGTRVTVRYEVVDGDGYRLLGVKIASGPIEHDSTTEPPSMPPASPAASDSIRQEPGNSPVLPEPTPEPEPEETTPATRETAKPSPPGGSVAAAVSGPRPGAQPEAATGSLPAMPTPPPPASREVVTMLTLLLASGALVWMALARL
jgi:hypothetical protein